MGICQHCPAAYPAETVCMSTVSLAVARYVSGSDLLRHKLSPSRRYAVPYLLVFAARIRATGSHAIMLGSSPAEKVSVSVRASV